MKHTPLLLLFGGLCALSAAAQAPPPSNNRDIANNVRGETINKRQNLNDMPTLNHRPTIPVLSAPPLVRRQAGGPAAKPPAVISVGEDQVPTRTQLEMLRRSRENEIPLADIARETRRQRDASRGAPSNRKRWVLEQQ